MEPQRLQPGRGWEWIKQGYALFMKAPLLWIVLLMILFFAAIILSYVPVIGGPLATLLMPLMLAGLMHGCRTLEQGEELELAHLFSGFYKQTGRLITLGGIALIGQYLILGVMMVTGGAALVGILMNPQPDADPAVLIEALSGAIFAVSLGGALYLFLTAVIQFSTLLVYFNGAPPIQAMQLAFRAFIYNILPFLVYGIIFSLLAIFATLPLALGWLVLWPVSFTSLYACYRDIFPLVAEISAAPQEGEASSSEDQASL